MNRFDRALGILMQLRPGATRSARSLARHFEVSTRTIYRDIETLCAVGVPVYAETGRGGGFRLAEGYFLPPITFSPGEATSLLTGLALLRRLRARPFEADAERAAEKLLAALPEQQRAIMERLSLLVGFERVPDDIWHSERELLGALTADTAAEARAVTAWLEAIFAHRAVALHYRSPYSGIDAHALVEPYGMLWDRDLWYLVGKRADADEQPRVWRADRVVGIRLHERPATLPPGFDIAAFLERSWLDRAMRSWAASTPVVIRVTRAQAQRLRRDWYYGHALFEDSGAETLVMTIGEAERSVVFELLRWLGPGAELLSPEPWRAAFAAELRTLLADYS